MILRIRSRDITNYSYRKLNPRVPGDSLKRNSTVLTTLRKCFFGFVYLHLNTIPFNTPNISFDRCSI